MDIFDPKTASIEEIKDKIRELGGSTALLYAEELARKELEEYKNLEIMSR